MVLGHGGRPLDYTVWPSAEDGNDKNNAQFRADAPYAAV